MHPATRILFYLLSALALPGLNFFLLGVVLMGTWALSRGRVRAIARLYWRTRWLFLLLFVGYAYTLPGAAAWPSLGDYAPSWPGLQAALHQGLRLAVLLALLDLLIVSMPPARLMSGLHRLLSPLNRWGFPAERTTVRLALTLRAMELNAQSPRSLQAWRPASAVLDPDMQTCQVQSIPWPVRERWLLLALLAVAVLAWLG
ncbi:MAG: hypothetical protein ACOZB0_12105 [Pseudomonadota bacterium]